jgi:hypothetical protein
MRINGRSVLIPVDEKWNPLESIGAAPEYIPPTWDGPHTSLRLIQAFKTLSAIPVANGPRFKSSWWPHHPMEWIDIKAKEHEYLNDLDQAREAARQWARTRHRASSEEVSRMEAALSCSHHLRSNVDSFMPPSTASEPSATDPARGP